MYVRSTESATRKSFGRRKTDKGDETTKSVQTPKEELCGGGGGGGGDGEGKEETEIATKTRLVSFGGASEKRAKTRKR